MIVGFISIEQSGGDLLWKTIGVAREIRMQVSDSRSPLQLYRMTITKLRVEGLREDPRLTTRFRVAPRPDSLVHNAGLTAMVFLFPWESWCVPYLR
jgi:hypothetical protein